MSPKELGFYIHIPFCKVKCKYCHFFTFSGMDAKFERYGDSLLQEILLLKPFVGDNRKVNSIYIGGGTPSVVNASLISDIVKSIAANYAVADNCEVTIEANPESITVQKLESYLAAGINRISIGLQAWQSTTLKQLSRLYTPEEFVQKLELVKSAGFSNINLDLIFGLPNQTLKQWIESVDNAISCKPAHLSCYSLELDNNSHWGKMYAAGKLQPASQKLDRDMLRYAVKALTAKGFERYEISNFAKDGLYSAHNKNFWLFKDYIGIGASAHSYFDESRFNNPYSIEQYCAQIALSQLAHQQVAPLSKQEQMVDYTVLRLRLKEGLNKSQFLQFFGTSFESTFAKQIAELISKKLLKNSIECYLLTEKGRDLYNQIVMAFL